VKPFKLRIDWTCHRAYGDKVDVELHTEGEDEHVVLRRFDSPPEAAGWSRQWLADRGFDLLCDVDRHQREDHTYVILHPIPANKGAAMEAAAQDVEAQS